MRLILIVVFTNLSFSAFAQQWTEVADFGANRARVAPHNGNESSMQVMEV
jgi:hypothetical protein